MPSAGISIVWGGVAAGAITAVASIMVAWISREIKISEFRQAWINELRNDIANYNGAAERWFQKYLEVTKISDYNEQVRCKRVELLLVANEAMVILRRIQLRFNARDDNPDKDEDDAFLATLEAMIEPGKLDSSKVSQSWNRFADEAVARGRAILKREWEVVKRPWWHWVKRRALHISPHLASVGRQAKTRSKTAYEVLRRTFLP